MPVEYQDYPEIESLAKRLIVSHNLSEAGKARIKYLVKVAEKSPYLGQCCLPSGPWKFITDFDFIIWVWSQYWEQATPQEQSALLYHELLHITQTENDVWKLVKHPIEAFPEELLAYGAWHPSLRALLPITRIRQST